MCLSRALNLFGDVDPLDQLVKLILRIILAMTWNNIYRSNNTILKMDKRFKPTAPKMGLEQTSTGKDAGHH